MTNTMLPEFLIALFAGMVACVIMRKHTPRPIELALWAGLVWVCVLGVTGVPDKQSRALTIATFWGLSQLVGSLFGGGLQGVQKWMVDNRFLLADAAVLVAGVDLLLLAYLTSRREAAGWRPQVRLRDWMEMPPLAAPRPATVTVSGAEQPNRGFRVWAPVAAASAVTWTTFFLIWNRDVAIPTFGRRIRKAAVSADGARRKVAHTTGQVVEITDLPRRAAGMRALAASWLTEAGTYRESNWLGGSAVAPSNATDGGKDSDGTQRDRRDQLAS